MGLNLDDKKAVVAEVSAEVANAQTIAVAAANTVSHTASAEQLLLMEIF